MAFISELYAISENTEGYSVKTYEAYSTEGGGGNYSASNTAGQSHAQWSPDPEITYGSGETGDSGMEASGFGFGATISASACYTQTYESFSQSGSYSNTAVGYGVTIFNTGFEGDTSGTTNSFSNSSSTSTSNSGYRQTSFSRNGLSGTYKEIAESQGDGGGVLTYYSQEAEYFTTLNSDSQTALSNSGAYTYYTSQNGSVSSNSSTSNLAPNGAIAFLYSSAITSLTTNFLTTINLTETSYFDNGVSSSRTYIQKATSTISGTMSGVPSFLTSTLTMYGTGAKSYSYSLICGYDREGNIIFTGKTGAGSSLRDSNRDFLLCPSDATSFSYCDVLIGNFTGGRTTGYSSEYTLTPNSTSTIQTTITKTNINSIAINADALLYSSSTYTESAVFYSTQTETASFSYGDVHEIGTNSTFGSNASISCAQMIYTTHPYTKFYFTHTLTTSFEMTSYIYKTNSHTKYMNYLFGSSSATTSSASSTSGANNSATTSVWATYGTITVPLDINAAGAFSSNNSGANGGGVTTPPFPQVIQTSLRILSTRYNDYTSTYYTEALNAGNFINRAGSAFLGYSPSSASIAAFKNIGAISPFTSPKPTIRLLPYSGEFTYSSTSFNQSYSEDSSNTTFYQTTSSGSGTSVSSSSRSFQYSLVSQLILTTSEQSSMIVDEDAYSYGYGNFPQVYPIASNILYSIAYFASNGLYYLNDCIFTNNMAGIQYINGGQSFTYPIQKIFLPEEAGYVGYDHGVFVAATVVDGAQVLGDANPMGNLVGLEYPLKFFG